MRVIEAFAVVVLSSLMMIAARRLKCKIPVCPNCEFSLTDSFVDFALKYINGNGPSDGTCSATQRKYIFHGNDVGGNRDACCCFEDSPNVADCSSNNTKVQECPDNPGIGKREGIGAYFKRMGSFLKDAPTDGCCRGGTYKWIFPKVITGTTDICTCVTENKAFSEKVACIEEASSSSSSSSSEILEKPDVDLR